MRWSKVLRFGGAVLAPAVVALVFSMGAAQKAGAEGDAKPTYVGAASCKKCHLRQFKSWSETRMAKAFASLKPGEAKESKEKAKLDVNKDYTRDGKCVKCHVTGYGEPGGYPKLGADGAVSDAALAADRENVQCEMCHGPGSLYSPYMKDHEKDYNADEAKRLGMIKPDGKGCVECHRGGPEGSPLMGADDKFDAESKMKEDKATHAHFPKKK